MQSDFMGSLLTTFDLVIFFGALAAIMAVGLWAGRKEDTAVDFYLAGRDARWWAVAASIFGSNVSANHIVGMMGVGFSLGFVESHFELGAIAGLLLLCYGFLPVYRKLNVFTLSEYLGRRYNDASRVAYTIIMVIIIVVIQMVPGFYIGSRSLNILLLDESQFRALSATAEEVGDGQAPVASPLGAQGGTRESNGSRNSSQGGSEKVKINRTAYVVGILIMAVVTASYTIVGGLKAVIVTDVIQSLLMLIGAAVVAVLTLSQTEIGGWSGMMAIDAARGADAKMHLYLPSSHPERPWTGVLTGLMVLHFFYWGTNQFIVQRALAARTDREARLGIIAAGFFKLLIPFMSIGTGVAAFYLLGQRMPGLKFDGDTAFPMLIRQVVAPIGAGAVGLVATGLVGAILSSLDSMMNSAATLVTFDIYKRYWHPEASDKQLIRVGRVSIAVFVTGAAVLTIFIMDPNREEHFFTYVAEQQSKLVAGLVVAFALGMLWPRATAAGGLAAIVAGIVLSFSIPLLYERYLGTQHVVAEWFGPQLNFFHAVFLSAVGATVVHIVVSVCTKPDAEKGRLTWTGLGVFQPGELKRLAVVVSGTLVLYVVLGIMVVRSSVPPTGAGLVAGAWTWGLFLRSLLTSTRQHKDQRLSLPTLLREDRFWAGLLAAVAIFMMYHYY